MKKRTASMLLVCAAILGMSGGGGGEVFSGVGDTTRPGAVEPAVNAAAPGMVVHFDPVTGRIIENPSPAQLKESGAMLAPGVDQSGEGLQVKPSSVPGGGVMIDLQGRFQNTSVATIDENGDLAAPCLPGSPEPAKDGE